jgi:hypothetical protein
MKQIVDSIMALFRVDFTGRGELADRQVTYLSAVIAALQKSWHIMWFLRVILVQKYLQSVGILITPIIFQFIFEAFTYNNLLNWLHC